MQIGRLHGARSARATYLQAPPSTAFIFRLWDARRCGASWGRQRVTRNFPTKLWVWLFGFEVCRADDAALKVKGKRCCVPPALAGPRQQASQRLPKRVFVLQRLTDP